MTFLKKIEQRAPWWCSIYRVFGLNVQKSWLFIRKSANIDCSIYRKARDRVIEDLDQTSIYRLIGVATLLGRFIFRESNHLLPNFKTANVNTWCGEEFIHRYFILIKLQFLNCGPEISPNFINCMHRKLHFYTENRLNGHCFYLNSSFIIDKRNMYIECMLNIN